MPAKNREFKKGLTLIEVMLAILVMAVIVIGTAGFRYYSALDARKAVKEADAARIGLMFLEAWRGRLGDATFDPKTQIYNPGNTFITGPSGSFPAPPTGVTWNQSRSYTVTMKSINPSENALTYYVTISYNDGLKTGLRILNATVAWPISIIEKDYTTTGNYWTFSLTNYVEN